jgi:hypothetical protein
MESLSEEVQRAMGGEATQLLDQSLRGLENVVDEDGSSDRAFDTASEPQQLVGASYRTLKAFLDSHDPTGQHYGLTKVQCEGYVAWVAEGNEEEWKKGCEKRVLPHDTDIEAAPESESSPRVLPPSPLRPAAPAAAVTTAAVTAPTKASAPAPAPAPAPAAPNPPFGFYASKTGEGLGSFLSKKKRWFVCDPTSMRITYWAKKEDAEVSVLCMALDNTISSVVISN